MTGQISEVEAIKIIKECRNTPDFQPYHYVNQALDMAMDALEKQIKLKTWIENYKKKDELLFDKSNVISLLEEFRLE